MTSPRVCSPSSLSEALALLAHHGSDLRPLAGGTDLMVVLQTGRTNSKALLDLSGLPELKGIQVHQDVISLGATTTYREVEEHPELHHHFPNLVKSARATGARAIQNRGTLGGNIANASPAADTPPALLAYGAELELVSSRGSRRIAYDAFHLDYKRMDLAPDELVAWIHLPLTQGKALHYYRKVGTRMAQAISKTCLAAWVQVKDGRIAEVRLGLGAVAPVPLRAKATEDLLRGARLGALPIQAARETLQGEIRPIDDLRSTAHYRRTVSANLLEEMLRHLPGE